MSNTKSILFVVFILTLITACSPIRTVTPLPAVTLPPLGAPTNAATPSDAAQTLQPNPTQPISTPPAIGLPVSLQVLSPQDGAFVNTSQILVNGLASPGNVVTVNDDIIVVGSDGQFQSTVSLYEGPNLIEIITSDDSGGETSVELTVTYEP